MIQTCFCLITQCAIASRVVWSHLGNKITQSPANPHWKGRHPNWCGHQSGDTSPLFFGIFHRFWYSFVHFGISYLFFNANPLCNAVRTKVVTPPTFFFFSLFVPWNEKGARFLSLSFIIIILVVVMKNDKGGEGLVSMRETGTPSVHKLGERDGSGNDEGDQNIQPRPLRQSVQHLRPPHRKSIS